ncbi:MAG: YeeE/YedE family protein, partial [Chitinophagaceae bacterium]|nr:YeeE/YedE family protein [Chitinophagaceae bacterium]
LLGGILVALLLQDPEPVRINAKLSGELEQLGISNYNGLVPEEIFNWNNLLSLKGIIMMVGGGFLVGFGTRYAGGCTSGHAIMGLSNLQWPSLVATISFMAGGFLVANIVLPYLLKL